eukprot:3101463-Pyramimonas_sp.AAC.2
MPLVFASLLHEALFATRVFPSTMMYLHATHCSEQPAMLPDLPDLDCEQHAETSDHAREQTINRVRH